jgi:hypothetical protein
VQVRDFAMMLLASCILERIVFTGYAVFRRPMVRSGEVRIEVGKRGRGWLARGNVGGCVHGSATVLGTPTGVPKLSRFLPSRTHSFPTACWRDTRGFRGSAFTTHRLLGRGVEDIASLLSLAARVIIDLPAPCSGISVLDLLGLVGVLDWWQARP